MTVETSRAMRRLLIASALGACSALPLAGCSTIASKIASVEPLERVVGPHDPVSPGGGRYQVGKPYSVAGRTYVPREETNYDAVGVASWYGGDYHHGTRTANGEVYDRTTLSAAHPTMPLPSYARVTSVATGRSVIVRVNDRGPFAAGRLIDISEKTAEVLNIKSRGISRVRVQYVGRAGLGGSDQRVLMASLRGPGVLPAGDDRTMVASADLPIGPRRAPGAAPVVPPIMVASADPAPVVAPAPKSSLAPTRVGSLPTVKAFAAADASAFELAGVDAAMLRAALKAPPKKPAQTSAEVIALDLPGADGAPMSLIPLSPNAALSATGATVVGRTSYAAESRIAAAHAIFAGFGDGASLGRLPN